MPSLRTLPLRNAGLGAALTALTLAGCGGGGSSQSLSHEELVKRADTICADGQSSFRKIQRQPPRSAKDAERQTGRLIAAFRKEIAALRGLKPPEDASGSFEAYLKAREEAIPILEKAREAAGRNKPQEYVNANEELTRGQPRRHDLAKKAGFAICSKLPSAGEATETPSG